MKIAVVEDELIIATTLVKKLNSLGYEVLAPCSTYNEAIQLLAAERPNVILIDIRLKGKLDGVDLAHYVRNNYEIPIVFATANGDAATIERAKMAKPNAYVIKPFTKQELHAAIEIALVNFTPTTSERLKDNSKEFVLVKISHDLIRIPSAEIVYMESNGNYVDIVMHNSRLRRFRITLASLEEQLDLSLFFRVSRSVIVNFKYVAELTTDSVIVGGRSIPSSKAYRSRHEMFHAFANSRAINN
jgi:DNA-binding LytR/AlgR family response regulator